MFIFARLKQLRCAGAKFKDGDYDEHPTSEELRRPIETGAYEESGYQLTGGQSIGYALVCSGTDVNVYVNDGLALSVMTDTVKRARFDHLNIYTYIYISI